MNAKRIHRQLSLESLETRTLLAGGADFFGLGADLTLAQSALSGLGDYSSSFSTNWGNKQLVITGTSATSLTIDLDRLPDFITNLKISSFASVTLLGNDDVNNLILKDIGSFNAAGLDVNVIVTATNVGALTLDSVGQTAMLEGSSMDLSVRSLTDTLIFSDLNKLKISSESPALYLQTGNDQQKIELTYRPELQISGMPKSSVEVRLPGSNPNPPPALGGDPVTPPVNPGNGGSGGSTTDPVDEVPTEPVGGSTDPLPGTGSNPETPPTNDPTTPSVPDEVFVIDFPADERMRQFVADLRQFLRNAAEDPRLAGFQLVGFGSAGTLPTSLGTGDDAIAVLAPASEHLNPIPDIQPEEIGFSDEHNDLLSISQQFVSDSWGSAGNALRLPASELPAPHAIQPSSDLVAVGQTVQAAPYAPTPSTVSEDSTSRPAESYVSEIIDNVRAFGGYLVERVAAEFTPGQQSMVLLVDPKPARGGTASRNTALETFAAETGAADAELLQS